MMNDNEKGAKALGLSSKKRITESPKDLHMAHGPGKDQKPIGTKKGKAGGAQYR